MEATQGQEKDTIIIEPPAVIVPEIIMPVEEKPEDKREIAHTIKDPIFGEFVVYKMEGPGKRPWWLREPLKLDKLITAFKGGHNVKNSLFYAGLTDEQWESILGAYPDIRRIKEVCSANPSFRAMNAVQEAIATDPHLAYKYLRERGDFNFPTRGTEGSDPLQPNVNIAVGININEGKIQDTIIKIARSVYGSIRGGKGEDKDRTNGSVAPVQQG